MRNLFSRAVKHDTTRPSLKERATGLKATAARVMKRRAAAPDAPSPALVGMARGSASDCEGQSPEQW